MANTQICTHTFPFQICFPGALLSPFLLIICPPDFSKPPHLQKKNKKQNNMMPVRSGISVWGSGNFSKIELP